MSSSTPRRPPTPGSDAALALGWICPVLDNNHGLDSPWPPDGWWITQGCPVHDGEERMWCVGDDY
jgi:hypothetical protein